MSRAEQRFCQPREFLKIRCGCRLGILEGMTQVSRAIRPTNSRSSSRTESILARDVLRELRESAAARQSLAVPSRRLSYTSRTR